MHCFTGTKNSLIDYLDLGVHIGLTGWICDDRRGKHLRDFIDIIPDDKLLIETPVVKLTLSLLRLITSKDLAEDICEI